MKTKLLMSTLAFLCMTVSYSAVAKDLAVPRKIEGEKKHDSSSTKRAHWLFNSVHELEQVQPLESKNRLTTGSTSMSLSSRPNHGVSIDGKYIEATILGANLNIKTLENELGKGDKTLVATLDLVVEEDIKPSLATSQTLTLKSGRDIVFNYGVALQALAQPLHVVLWSDTDGDEAGGVLLDLTSSIHTQGGHLWVGGGSQSSSWKGLEVGDSYAVGLTTNALLASYPFAGINLVGSEINTGEGEIYLHGKSTQTVYRDGIGVRVMGMNLTANGIYIHGIGSTNGNTEDNTNRGNWGVGLENTHIHTTGDFYVYGEGGGQLAGLSGGLNYGILLNNNTSVIAQDEANLSFVGKGGGNPDITTNRDNDGIRINGGLIRVDKGILKLYGVPGLHSSSADVDQKGGVVESRDSSGNLSSGSIVVEADHLHMASTVRYKSLGELKIFPRTATSAIDVGGFAGQLNLPSRFFDSNFEDGFDKITLGSPEQSGDILMTRSTFHHSLEVQTQGKLSFSSDFSTTGASDFTIVTDHLDFNTPTHFTIDGEFQYRPFTHDLQQSIVYPIANLDLASKGLVLGSENCQAEVFIKEALTTPHDLVLGGKHIHVEGNLKTLGNASLHFNGNTSIAPGVVLASEGNMSHRGNLIFKSDKTGDATLGEVKGTFTSETGEAIVEKYHFAKRAFRLISSPINASETIFESFQNGGHFSEGKGTHISGSQTGEHGFDFTSTGNPSMYEFNSELAWMPISNTDQTKISAGVPYRMLVRGDRGISLEDSISEANETTLVVKGGLTSGDFSYQPQTYKGLKKNHSMVGNPYQSKININELLSNSVDVNPNHYYVWDPHLNKKGGYVTVDLRDGGNIQASTSAGYFVNPGEAFFIEAETETPVLNFSEGIKHSEGNSDHQPEVRSAEISSLDIQLLNATQEVIDGIKFKFDEGGNNSIDLEDAGKMENQDENLAIVHGQQFLSIESRNMPERSESIDLLTNHWRSSAYSFKISMAHLEGTDIVLYDRYLDEKVLVNHGDVYNFNVDPSVEASADSNRFAIAFSKETLSTLGFENASLQLYPNPVQNEFRISTPWIGENLELEVFSLLGQQVMRMKVKSDAIEVDSSSLRQGVYIVKLSRGTEVFTTKMIKQ